MVVAFSIYVVMLAGAGAVLHEYLGTPVWAGAAAMALAVFVTTYFGLRRLVEVIGWLGPLLIVLIIVLAATALLQNAGGITRGAAIASALEMPRAAPALAVAFSWIMLAAIFTTAVPLLWIATVRLAVDGSPRYRMVAAALGPLPDFGQAWLADRRRARSGSSPLRRLPAQTHQLMEPIRPG